MKRKPIPWRYRLALPLRYAHRLRRLMAPRLERPAFRILILHGVAEHELAALDRLLAHIKRHHGVLAPEEAAEWLSGVTISRNPSSGRLPCLLSFDDGFRNNARAAREVLAAQGVKALFFVCPGLMALSGRNQMAAVVANVFDGAQGTESFEEEYRLLEWNDLTDLVRSGHTIGAHGMTHRRLARLKGEDLAREVADSGMALAARLGSAPTWFAYAFGDIDSISQSALEQIGAHFRFCRSGVRGVNGPATNRLALRADAIDLSAPSDYQKFVLEGGLDSRYARARSRLDAFATSNSS